MRPSFTKYKTVGNRPIFPANLSLSLSHESTKFIAHVYY